MAQELILDDRKQEILKSIVANYLETGEPVGSRTISKMGNLNLSSATIRNEMSDLEEMGYVVQPRTSAGRIPTDKGYRFYVDKMMEKLTKPGVSCVGTFWSFYPDKQHSAFSLFLFELIRDTFLWVQHFKRPELNIRGMTFAFNADYARQCTIRTDIRRGEDGSLALELKRFGKIVFLYNRKARPVTGYGTIGKQSVWQSFIDHVKVQMKGITRIFHSTDHYEDSEDNLVKNK